MKSIVLKMMFGMLILAASSVFTGIATPNAFAKTAPCYAIGTLEDAGFECIDMDHGFYTCTKNALTGYVNTGACKITWYDQ